MKRILILLLSSLSFLLSAQVSDNALLWRISGNGLSEPSYLFGTIHLLPATELNLNDSIKYCIGRSKTLIMEADLDIPPSEQQNILAQMRLPAGKTVKDYIEPELYRKFYGYLVDSIGINEANLQQYILFKPFFFASFIMYEMIEDPLAFDTEIAAFAKDLNFVPLETLQEQMDMIDSVPLEDQITFTDNTYKVDKEYEKLKTLYLNKDLKGIEKMIIEDPDYFKSEAPFLSDRNLNWVPRIETAIKEEGPCFVAVGCAHLIGEEGLINLLRKDGYTLSPVFFPPQ